MCETGKSGALLQSPEAAIGTASVEQPGEALTLSVVEERLALSKRRAVTGKVRVASRTEKVDVTAQIELDRYRVEVERVPIGRVVEETPEARTEGDVTIIPVIEERLVIVKELYLKEEIHLRHVVDRKVVKETVTLRRQHAVVTRDENDR